MVGSLLGETCSFRTHSPPHPQTGSTLGLGGSVWPLPWRPRVCERLVSWDHRLLLLLSFRWALANPLFNCGPRPKWLDHLTLHGPTGASPLTLLNFFPKLMSTGGIQVQARRRFIMRACPAAIWRGCLEMTCDEEATHPFYVQSHSKWWSKCLRSLPKFDKDEWNKAWVHDNWWHIVRVSLVPCRPLAH